MANIKNFLLQKGQLASFECKLSWMNRSKIFHTYIFSSGPVHDTFCRWHELVWFCLVCKSWAVSYFVVPFGWDFPVARSALSAAVCNPVRSVVDPRPRLEHHYYRQDLQYNQCHGIYAGFANNEFGYNEHSSVASRDFFGSKLLIAMLQQASTYSEHFLWILLLVVSGTKCTS